MDHAAVEAIEIRLLLEAVYQRYGFDFRDYAAHSIRRRIANQMQQEGINRVSELQGRLLREPDCMERFLSHLTVHVTSMFRDPGFYLAFRINAVPLLRDLPFFRVWHVGCSTGEEVYSMAILLQEEDLYSRCRIYATDIDQQVVETARAGIVSLDGLQEFTRCYLQAGGKACFSDYYTARYGNAIFERSLRQNLVFSQHNLVTDGSFNEFHVILCRNVMIYFNASLAARVHRLFYESLVPGGLLGLGNRESLKFTAYETAYKPLDSQEQLYRRVAE